MTDPAAEFQARLDAVPKSIFRLTDPDGTEWIDEVRAGMVNSATRP